MATDTSSLLTDLRDIPLTELDDGNISEVLKRIFPDAPRVPDSAFNSAI